VCGAAWGGALSLRERQKAFLEISDPWDAQRTIKAMLSGAPGSGNKIEEAAPGARAPP